MEDETSCSRSDTLSDTEDVDLTSLIPYDFEPETSAESNTDSESDNVEDGVHSDESNLKRIGNIYWCECNCCRFIEYVSGKHLLQRRCSGQLFWQT